MLLRRVIPVLLLRGGGLYKTVRFRHATYVGDPLNVLRIFNDKEVDEVVVLDIAATPAGRGPDFDLLADMASECFMPMCYGGGLRSLADIERVFSVGIEKVALNTVAVEDPSVVQDAVRIFGSQSITVSVDVARRRFRAPSVRIRCGQQDTGADPAVHARRMEGLGAGEVIVTSIDREGTRSGYDLELIREVSGAVSVPVVANGGARGLPDLADALHAGASAVAAGSMFVFNGPHRAVLISYPSADQRAALP